MADQPDRPTEKKVLEAPHAAKAPFPAAAPVAAPQQSVGDEGRGFSNSDLQEMKAALMAVQGAAAPTGAQDLVDPNIMAACLMMMPQPVMASGSVAGGLPHPFMPFPGLTPFAQQEAMEPSITVRVEGVKDDEYELIEDDLREEFSRYGKVMQIRIAEKGQLGVITYDTMASAQAAISALNDEPLAKSGLRGFTTRFLSFTPGLT
eukprot:TRINITY_DN596_c0_g1_i3.p1 TRINITY_DN596_c0_g1~~TRINITY_DN596_c0_g1_i3.p1  ORF type:complete len:205 (+),score=39.36 TRINITY_DN596_c0_g1_i3:52-666(+)